MPSIMYFEEIVGEEIECECGYSSGYVDYYSKTSKMTSANDEWTCPQCGKTEILEEYVR